MYSVYPITTEARGSDFSLNVLNEEPGPSYPGVMGHMQRAILHATYIASIPIGIRCDVLTVFVMLKKFNFELNLNYLFNFYRLL